MSRILDKIFRRTAPSDERRSWDNFVTAYRKAGYETTTGETVDDDSALSIATVYACVRVLSETMASLPCNLFRRHEDGSRERIRNHPIVRLLEVAPNPEMTAFELRQLRMVHKALRGNAYHLIQRNGGTPVALWPLHPDAVEVTRADDGSLAYRHQQPSGSTIMYQASDILHFKNFGENGLIGRSPLTACRETFAHYLSAQKFGGKFFANNAWVSGVIEHPGEVGKEGGKRMAEGWAQSHGGDNTGGIAVLEEGASFRQLSIAPEDAQFIETIKLKRVDVCAIMRVPPHMAGDLERATFSNIESQDLFFGKHTVMPECESEEQVLNMKLLTGKEQGEYYIEHNLAGLYRGDLKTRIEAMSMLWDRGIVNADQVREMENMNPQPDGMGKKFYVPVNFAEAGSPRQFIQPQESNSEPCGCGTEHREKSAGTSHNITEQRYSRITIQRSFNGIIDDAMNRVVRRDIQKIKAAMKRELRSEGSFVEWLNDYYSDTEYTRRQVTPAFVALAEALGPELSSEVEAEWVFNDALRSWVDSYVDTFAEHYANGSRDDLTGILADADEDVAELLEARLDVWENGDKNGSSPRTSQVGRRESTRFGGALARTVMVGAGVTTLVWQSSGDACPWCSNMNGQTVGVERPFIASGDTVTATNGETMNPSQDVMHPPLHDGCECVIIRG